MGTYDLCAKGLHTKRNPTGMQNDGSLNSFLGCGQLFYLPWRVQTVNPKPETLQSQSEQKICNLQEQGQILIERKAEVAQLDLLRNSGYEP